MRRLLILAFLLAAPLASAQFGSFQQWCQAGGQTVNVSGIPSTTTVQASYPQCQVTVYLTGTTTPAAIYSTVSGTALSNPYCANLDGSFLFFAAQSLQYDVVIANSSICNPVPQAQLPASFTFSDIAVSNVGGGGGSGSVLLGTAGNSTCYLTSSTQVGPCAGLNWIGQQAYFGANVRINLGLNIGTSSLTGCGNPVSAIGCTVYQIGSTLGSGNTTAGEVEEYPTLNGWATGYNGVAEYIEARGYPVEGAGAYVPTAGTIATTHATPVCTDSSGNGSLTTVGCPSSSGVTGSGSTGYLPEWTGSSSLGNSPLQDQSAPVLIEPTNTYALYMAASQFGTTISSGNSVLGNLAALWTKQTYSNGSNCISSNRCPVLVSAANDAENTASSANTVTSGFFSSGVTIGSSSVAQGSITGIDVYAMGTVYPTISNVIGVNAEVGCRPGLGAAGCPTSYIGGGSGITITNQYGGSFVSNAMAATHTVNAGVYVLTEALGQSGGSSVATVATDAGLYVDSPTLSSGGVFTHHYGLYMADQTTAGSGTNSDPWGIYQVAGKNAFGGAMGQTAANKWAGKCTMTTTTCTVTLGVTYTTPICVAMLQGTGTVIAGECSVSGTTATVTAASSNTGTWAVVVFGDPE